ncbi:AAC(3) family N-acetyltransferase [Hazenella sp. IB182353]|uniref:aminoglycoside N(3)-acetyltransferase n=1 Tax=Polycladospora coralii TaxID=2771432 RepID=UPI00174791D8|nr:AAC(3) family N-acetyltransferase [Polycladospora coralii]MBS7529390.1 AAC(3) family N-acetyltransferase [Polycladospora coralii]
MSETENIQAAQFPQTIDTLVHDLKNIGIQQGMTIIVHSSLSSIGWVCGGAQTVVEALMKVLTPAGTLVMPTHSAILSDPKDWGNPPVPEAWWQTIREQMPAYDPHLTPTFLMGKIVDCFRSHTDTIRSSHPKNSFAAWGKHAHLITANHSLAFSMGENSPLARLYDLDAYVLLLGVDFDSNTSFHLAEYRQAKPPVIEESAPIIAHGKRVWKTYQDIETAEETFAELGKQYVQKYSVKQTQVGQAPSYLFSQRQAVDFALQSLQGR